ncbi:MAG: hypothetical protein V3S14_09370 [Anaerolineae bacterium]
MWGFYVLPLVVGIPVVTMTFNWPTLPLLNTAACVVATLIGLALALPSGSWAAQRPTDLCWLALDGLGLMPTLSLLHAVELPARGLVSVPVAFLAVLGGTVAGVVWLGIMTGLRAWRRKPLSGAGTLFVTGLCQNYLLMPLVRHIFSMPPGYRYISTASNFFGSGISQGQGVGLLDNRRLYLVGGAVHRNALAQRTRKVRESSTC